jgi:hypothetical protein
MLRTADGPLGVREVAQRMGCIRTRRFHLEGLVEAGLAVRETEDREVPGRPRLPALAHRRHAGYGWSAPITRLLLRNDFTNLPD